MIFNQSFFPENVIKLTMKVFSFLFIYIFCIEPIATISLRNILFNFGIYNVK